MIQSIFTPFDYYWQVDLALRLFLILQINFVGLWCIWGGLGRPNWFVRITAVLGCISLLLIIPAFDLVLISLVQASLTISFLVAWRTKRAASLSNEPSRCRWQYSIRDLLLLAVFVAWLSAMLTRVPTGVWAEWRDLTIGGTIAAFFTLVAAWIALSKARWWMRLPFLCIAIPSLPMVAWLRLMRSAGLVRSGPNRCGWTARAGFALISVLIALPLAAVYSRLAISRPIPQATLPNPNGYDDLVAAGNMIQRISVPIAESTTHAQLRTFATQSSRVYDLVQTGLGKPCQVPVIWDDPDMKFYFTQSTGFRELARGLRAKAMLAELDGRIDDAVTANLTTVRLGMACVHGGLLVHWFLDVTFTGMGQEGLCRVRGSLSAKQCHALISTLETLVGQWDCLAECLERNAIYDDNVLGWRGRFINSVNAITGANEAIFRQISGRVDTALHLNEQIRDRDLARMRLLICDLAIRAYVIDHGRRPDKLADLVPGYLSNVPKDPFTSGPLVYHLTPSGYRLYSVGADRVDNSGRRSGPGGLAEGNDILLDDPSDSAPAARTGPTGQ